MSLTNCCRSSLQLATSAFNWANSEVVGAGGLDIVDSAPGDSEVIDSLFLGTGVDAGGAGQVAAGAWEAEGVLLFR